MNIFITGTGTDVGKTVISAWICRRTGAEYWKPIQTGADSDSNTVRFLSPKTEILKEIYSLKAPLSPYDAANFEGIKIDLEQIVTKTPKKTVIEGAGGVLVPISEKFFMIDIAERTKSKVLVVGKSKLGFLNHIFLTINVLRARNIDILGIIINGEVENFLVRTIEKISKCKVLQVFPTSQNLLKTFDELPVPPAIEEILK